VESEFRVYRILPEDLSPRARATEWTYVNTVYAGRYETFAIGDFDEFLKHEDVWSVFAKAAADYLGAPKEVAHAAFQNFIKEQS
jgi:hypothetical protein